MSQYCLPVLNPKLVSCTPVENNKRVRYVYMSSRTDTYLLKAGAASPPKDTYEVIMNPGDVWNETYVLTSTNHGIMTASRSKRPDEITTTIVKGSGIYANLLSSLSIDQSFPVNTSTYNETVFTLLCDMPYDDTIYT